MPSSYQSGSPHDPAPIYQNDALLGDVAALTPSNPQYAKDIREMLRYLIETMPSLHPGEGEITAFQFGVICGTKSIEEKFGGRVVPVFAMRTQSGLFLDDEEDDHDEDEDWPEEPMVLDGQIVYARDGSVIPTNGHDTDLIFSVLIYDPARPRMLTLYLVADEIRLTETEATICEHCGGLDVGSHDDHEEAEQDPFSEIIADEFGEESLRDYTYANEEASAIFFEMVFWFFVQVKELRNRFEAK